MYELKRGDQFKYFTGKHSGMAATGACLPKGGAPGDAYNYYVDFEVELLAGLHRAFDYAEVYISFHLKMLLTFYRMGYFSYESLESSVLPWQQICDKPWQTLIDLGLLATTSFGVTDI